LRWDAKWNSRRGDPSNAAGTEFLLQHCVDPGRIGQDGQVFLQHFDFLTLYQSCGLAAAAMAAAISRLKTVRA
jgi:hypothetical protein